MELVGHYVDGSLRTGAPQTATPVENPATEEIMAICGNAGPDLVAEAVTAARTAAPGWAAVPLHERLDYLHRWRDAMDRETDAFVDTVVDELGVTPTFARNIHIGRSVRTFDEVARAATQLLEPRTEANSVVVREPAGVVAAVTAWNFGMHMFVSKVASALAVGNTVVIKPSEVKPLAAWKAALLLAELGLPPGVVNVVNGTGPDTGLPLVSHPDVDMVGLTGSRETGKRVLEATAANITRCVLELGGKSVGVILPGAPLEDAIAGIIGSCFFNNGQVCGAQTRMLVLRDDLEEVEKMVAAAVEDVVVGDPRADGTRLGPVVSRRQHERVSRFIAEGVDRGLDVLTGGAGRPPELPRGYYVRPTVFTDVPSSDRLAQEEIFGPVLCMIAGETIDDLAAVANDSSYGLAGAVWAATTDDAVSFARRIRTGQVQINGGAFNLAAPYGGFKQSGIGREHGLEGLAEYTELKSMQLPA